MPSTKKVKLIIDTDGVSDDIRAISLAMQHPNVEVIAFTVVHGCVTVDQACANVARAQRANNVSKPIKIYRGAAHALITQESVGESETFFFGKDGLGDQPEAFPEVVASDFKAYESEPAAIALIRLTKEHPDAVLVCLGPLTNVALALKLDDHFCRQLPKIVIMGGNYYGIGNVGSHSSAEFNFHGDPEAAAIVFKDMKSPMTIVPWEAFFLEGPQHQKEVDFHKHLDYDTHLASFFATAISIGQKELAKKDRQYSYCDEIAVAVAIDEDLVVKRAQYLRAEVELAGTLSRGQVVIDWTDVLWEHIDEKDINASGKNVDRSTSQVKFVTSYNVKTVDQWIHNAVQGLPAPW